MYSGRPKTRCNRRPIAAVFAPAAIGPPQLLVFLVVMVDVLKLYACNWLGSAELGHLAARILKKTQH